jgi:hypothetical protein
MKTFIVANITLLFALGCGASYPPPTQQMADVQAADRSAVELGAQANPKAQLHLKLAEEQLALAKTAMDDDDNEVATSLLGRAKADAELAIALTREEKAKTSAHKAVDQSNAARSTNPEQGVTQ